jgi:uncharacterized membrane protein YhaH (DUF805 family)
MEIRHRIGNDMRIGRIGFVVGTLALMAMGAGKDGIAAVNPFGLDPAMIAPVVGVLCVVGLLALVTWRCHDFNETFWRVFWIDQVPFVGQFWALWLLLSNPGTEGMNSYGHPPPF